MPFYGHSFVECIEPRFHWYFLIVYADGIQTDMAEY